MPPAAYSYIDVAALDAVRNRFAAGDVLVIVSTDLAEIIWANGPGAGLFGQHDIEALIGADTGFGPAARRQIMSTRGFPHIGRDRSLTIRLNQGMNSQAIAFRASAIVMPDGEDAILLARQSEATPGSGSRRAISGFTQPGHLVALLDSRGAIEAASAGFDRLGIPPQALADLVREVSRDRDRLIKRIIAGAAARYPAGIARLQDDPARHLLMVVDERDSEEDATAEAPTTTAAPEGEADFAARPERGDFISTVEKIDQDEPNPAIGAEEAAPAPLEHVDMAEAHAIQTIEPMIMADDLSPAQTPGPDTGAPDVADGDPASAESIHETDAVAFFVAPDGEAMTPDERNTLAALTQADPSEAGFADAGSLKDSLDPLANPGPGHDDMFSSQRVSRDTTDALDTEQPPVADEETIGTLSSDGHQDSESVESSVEGLAATASGSEVAGAEISASDHVAEATHFAEAQVFEARVAEAPMAPLDRVADGDLADGEPLADEPQSQDAVSATADVDIEEIKATAAEPPSLDTPAPGDVSIADDTAASLILDGSEKAETAQLSTEAMDKGERAGAEAADLEDAAAPADTTGRLQPPGPSIESPVAEHEAGKPAAPVRFVWRTDASGRFSAISSEFVAAVGQSSGDIIGRTFKDVSDMLSLDPVGDIAGLLERRDTWSGRSVKWPIAGTDLKVPVDLAALPVYARDRTFEGFRGFGVARMADAVMDPEAIGLKLASDGTIEAFSAASAGLIESKDDVAQDAATPADPFRGEVPALTIVPQPDRRFSDKIIRLAEHRNSLPERALSSTEKVAFREIGERLKKVDNADRDPAKGTPPEQPVAAREPAAWNDTVPSADKHQETVTDLSFIAAPPAPPEETDLGRGVQPVADAALASDEPYEPSAYEGWSELTPPVEVAVEQTEEAETGEAAHEQEELSITDDSYPVGQAAEIGSEVPGEAAATISNTALGDLTDMGESAPASDEGYEPSGYEGWSELTPPVEVAVEQAEEAETGEAVHEQEELSITGDSYPVGQAAEIGSEVPGEAAATISDTALADLTDMGESAPASDEGYEPSGYEGWSELTPPVEVAVEQAEEAETGEAVHEQEELSITGDSYPVGQAAEIGSEVPGEAAATISDTALADLTDMGESAPASDEGYEPSGYEGWSELTPPVAVTVEQAEEAETGEAAHDQEELSITDDSYPVEQAAEIGSEFAEEAAPTVSDTGPAAALSDATESTPASDEGYEPSGYEGWSELTPPVEVAVEQAEEAESADAEHEPEELSIADAPYPVAQAAEIGSEVPGGAAATVSDTAVADLTDATESTPASDEPYEPSAYEGWSELTPPAEEAVEQAEEAESADAGHEPEANDAPAEPYPAGQTSPSGSGMSDDASATTPDTAQIAARSDADSMSAGEEPYEPSGYEGWSELTPPVEEAVELAEIAESVDQRPEIDQMQAEAQPTPLLQDETDPAETPLARPSDTTILARLPVPILIHSGDTLHYANDEFLGLTGYASVEALTEAGGLDALFSDAYAETASDDANHSLFLRTAEGQEFPIEALLRAVPWQGGRALMLVVRRTGEADAPLTPPLLEISERDELRARVAEMRTIIDTATDGVILIDKEGAIRSISRPAEALFGYESDEIEGKPFVSLFAMESQRAARDYLGGLSDNGVASVLNDGREVIGREAEGRFIPLFMSVGRLPNESGFCAVVRDLTQWKRAEEELTHARSLAERASSQKTDFLARISHEIRTPLNAIIGFSELMMDERFGSIGNERYRDYLRDINRSGNHVLDLVNDLLDISKIEAGEQEMAHEAVSLNETLGQSVAMMQPQANRERVIIRSSLASRLPDVVADLRSIRQIALNLLSNAIRYTQAGGQVIVSTSYEPSGEVIMRIRDTGIGMSPAEIEQALKPFKQINALKRTRGDGTGLGLPLTKAMVEANRARFTINSTPGEGTLVEVTFPSTRVLAH